MKFDSTRLEEISKLVEANSYETLLENFKDRQELYNFIYIIKGIEGLPRHISTHAAGIIISSFDLDMYDVGSIAMRMLTKLMSDEELDEAHVILPYTLKQSRSTK